MLYEVITATFEHRDNAGMSDAGLYCQTEFTKVSGHQRCCPGFPVRQLRMLVNVATPFEDARLDTGDLLIDPR